LVGHVAKFTVTSHQKTSQGKANVRGSPSVARTTHIVEHDVRAGVACGRVPREVTMKGKPGGKSMETSTHAAAIRLFLAREILVREWMARVLSDPLIPTARGLEPYRLRDYIPRFIDATTETLRWAGYGGKIRARAAHFARVHALERLDAFYSLDEVLREFAYLDAVLTEHLVEGTSAHVLMREVFEEARVTAEIAYAGQSGTHWTEAATATIPSALATALPDSLHGSGTSSAAGSDGKTPRR
jgi:hypothetical protein